MSFRDKLIADAIAETNLGRRARLNAALVIHATSGYHDKDPRRIRALRTAQALERESMKEERCMLVWGTDHE